MSLLLPGQGLLGNSDGPPLLTQAPSANGRQLLSLAGAMYSTLIQIRKHLGNFKQGDLKQLFQRIRRNFALVQLKIEFVHQPPTIQSTLFVTLENKLSFLEKYLLAKIHKHHSRPAPHHD